MKKFKQIIMILYGYFPSDARVRKEVISLSQKTSTKITIVCLKEDEGERIPGTDVISLLPNVGAEKRQSVIMLLKFWLFVTKFLLKQDKDLILHCHDLTGLPPIVIPKLLGRVKNVIYDSHEFFPEAARNELGWIFWVFFLSLEKFCSYFIDTIVGISPGQQTLMTNRYNKPYILVPNYPQLELINKLYLKPSISVNQESFNIICHGSVRKNRCFFTLLDSMEIAQNKEVKIKLIIIGDGPDLNLVKNYALSLNLRNVTFLGRIPFEETFQYLLGGNAAIGLGELNVYYAMGCPNKLYECIAAGKPTIFADLKGSRPVMKEAFIKRVNPHNKYQIYNAMLEIMKDTDLQEKIRTHGKELIREKYNWENVAQSLIDYYDNLGGNLIRT